MNPITYLDSLIAGMEMGSEIAVQISELKLLKSIIESSTAALINDAADATRYRFALESRNFAICQWDESARYHGGWRPIKTNSEIDAAIKGETK